MTRKQGRPARALEMMITMPEYRSGRTPRHKAHLAALGWGVILAFCAFVGQCSQANAEPYMQASGGCFIASDVSNRHSLEFNGDVKDCSWAGAAEGGYTFDLGPVDLDLGAEAGYQNSKLHGRGDGRSADGETFEVFSARAVARASHEVVERIDLFLGSGFGAAYVSGLDDEDLAPTWMAEAGVRFGFHENMTAHIGYRAVGLFGVRLNDSSGGPAFHGPFVGLRWQFSAESALVNLEYLSDREPLEAR